MKYSKEGRRIKPHVKDITIAIESVSCSNMNVKRRIARHIIPP
jgi:hypothetical protein